jgi:hypothetical protein
MTINDPARWTLADGSVVDTMDLPAGMTVCPYCMHLHEQASTHTGPIPLDYYRRIIRTRLVTKDCPVCAGGGCLKCRHSGQVADTFISNAADHPHLTPGHEYSRYEASGDIACLGCNVHGPHPDMPDGPDS